MNFIQPFMLWGMLGIAIPIVVHLWNKQKGKVIEWAASQWLVNKSEQRHRGLRFDNLLLMLLRCLLIILLAFLLSKPIFNVFGRIEPGKIHLVEPQKNVVENFRFELESALKNGDRLYWLGSDASAITDLTKIPVTEPVSPYSIQRSINNAGKNGDLHLYLTNRQELASAFYVPENFKVHPVVDTAGKRQLNFKGFGRIKVLLEYQNPLETQTVHAALQALAGVYSFPFSIDIGSKPGTKYDWILTDKSQRVQSPEANYIFSGLKGADLPNRLVNAVYNPEAFQIQTSEIVSSGRLPEWLGQQFLDHYKMERAGKPLSSKQFNALFIRSGESVDTSWETLQKWLYAAFITLLMLERGISLKKMNV